MSIPEHLRGDGPCSDCGTVDNPRWFTDSVFWNEVVRQGDSVEPILCVNCFVKRVDQSGFACNWRLLPEWHWETKAERLERMRDDNYKAPAPLERLVVTTLVPVVPPGDSLAALRVGASPVLTVSGLAEEKP